MLGVLSREASEQRSPRRAKLQTESSRLLPDQEGNAQDGQERTLPLRERQEVQEVLWRMSTCVRILTMANYQTNRPGSSTLTIKMSIHAAAVPCSPGFDNGSVKTRSSDTELFGMTEIRVPWLRPALHSKRLMAPTIPKWPSALTRSSRKN